VWWHIPSIPEEAEAEAETEAEVDLSEFEANLV